MSKTSWEQNIHRYFKKQQLDVQIDSNIICQLNEFALKYASELLSISKQVAQYQKRSNIKGEDVGLALKINEDKYGKCDQALIDEIAQTKNQQKLPIILDSTLKLPNHNLCQMKQNIQYGIDQLINEDLLEKKQKK